MCVGTDLSEEWSQMSSLLKKISAGAAALAGYTAAESLFIYHFGFEKASDALMRFWSRHNRTPEFAKDMIREGCQWLKDQDVREVSVTSFDGLTLRGHYLVNPNAERIVVAFHGYRSNAYYDFGAQVRFYYEAGCSLLLVEQRGHLCSDGDVVDMGILARHDVATWIKYVDEDLNAGRLPVFLAGISMGAATILMAQELNLLDNIKGMIADCGFSNTYEEVRYFGSRYGVLFSKQKMPLIEQQCKIRGGFSLREANPVDALKKARIPVLFIHGTDDQLMPVENSYQNYEACTAPKKLVLVEGADHAWSYFIDTELYEKEVKRFMAEYQ